MKKKKKTKKKRNNRKDRREAREDVTTQGTKRAEAPQGAEHAEAGEAGSSEERSGFSLEVSASRGSVVSASTSREQVHIDQSSSEEPDGAQSQVTDFGERRPPAPEIQTRAFGHQEDTLQMATKGPQQKQPSAPESSGSNGAAEEGESSSTATLDLDWKTEFASRRHNRPKNHMQWVQLVPASLWLFVLFFVLFLANVVWEPETSPLALFQAFSGGLEKGSTLAYLNMQTRSLGMILAAMITLCAISLPLTANNYTPKLINLFIASPVNQLMFGLLVSANVFTHWTMLISASGKLPYISIGITALLGLLCFVLMIPYAFYVFYTLQPEIIIRHIEQEIVASLHLLQDLRGKRLLDDQRKKIMQDLKYLSNITLRSIDRHDRDTALLSMEALRNIYNVYIALKENMPEEWFRIRRMDFLSKSEEMRRQVEEEKTFFEAELMEELALILSVSLWGLRDVVQMIGETMHHISLQAFRKKHRAAVNNSYLYFNSFIRACLSRRDAESIYIIIYHYRRLAEKMMLTSPQDTMRVAFYLDYYAHQATRSGMVYVSNLISYDLADLTTLAFRQNAACKTQLFELFLHFDREESMRDSLGVIKSHIKLAATLHSMNHKDEQESLCSELCKAREAQVVKAIADMEAVDTPLYWEQNNRRTHNDYISPSLMASFQCVKEVLLGHFRGASAGHEAYVGGSSGVVGSDAEALSHSH